MLAKYDRAYERASYIIECAKLDQEARDAMGVPNAPTPAQLKREADREYARKRDREIWTTIILPRIIKEAELATGRKLS